MEERRFVKGALDINTYYARELLEVGKILQSYLRVVSWKGTGGGLREQIFSRFDLITGAREDALLRETTRRLRETSLSSNEGINARQGSS